MAEVVQKDVSPIEDVPVKQEEPELPPVPELSFEEKVIGKVRKQQELKKKAQKEAESKKIAEEEIQKVDIADLREMYIEAINEYFPPVIKTTGQPMEKRLDAFEKLLKRIILHSVNLEYDVSHLHGYEEIEPSKKQKGLEYGKDTAKFTAKEIGRNVLMNINPLSYIDPFAFVHVPVLTIAADSIREYKLLKQHKTEMKTALSHIVFHALGITTGSLVGATIGNFILPGVGLFIGGVLGSAGGSYLYKRAKKAKFEEAVKELNQEIESSEKEFDNFMDELESHLTLSLNKCRKACIKAAKEQYDSPLDFKNKLEEFIKERKQSLCLELETYSMSLKSEVSDIGRRLDKKKDKVITEGNKVNVDVSKYHL